MQGIAFSTHSAPFKKALCYYGTAVLFGLFSTAENRLVFSTANHVESQISNIHSKGETEELFIDPVLEAEQEPISEPMVELDHSQSIHAIAETPEPASALRPATPEDTSLKTETAASELAETSAEIDVHTSDPNMQEIHPEAPQLPVEAMVLDPFSNFKQGAPSPRQLNDSLNSLLGSLNIEEMLNDKNLMNMVMKMSPNMLKMLDNVGSSNELAGPNGGIDGIMSMLKGIDMQENKRTTTQLDSVFGDSKLHEKRIRKLKFVTIMGVLAVAVALNLLFALCSSWSTKVLYTTTFLMLAVQVASVYFLPWNVIALLLSMKDMALPSGQDLGLMHELLGNVMHDADQVPQGETKSAE